MNNKLFKIRCDNCGAEYRLNSRGEMNCRFCGSKIYLNDKDFEEYQKVRDEMLVKDCINNDAVNTDGDILGFWSGANSGFLFRNTEKKEIIVNYFYAYKTEGTDTFICKNKIVYVTNNKNLFDKVDWIVYPSADLKNLRKYLPAVIYEDKLDDGRYLFAINKPENVYPLAMFNNLDAKQVAWMVSRMENLGCLFEFNNFDFEKINIKDIYINPKTHELFIYGINWAEGKIGETRNYLVELRKIAREVLADGTAPRLAEAFLVSSPEKTAYDDFHKWDDVIVRGFGGHNFHKFTN